jgi:hypothetical protein
MHKGTYVSYRESKDGQFYMYGYYPTGHSVQRYDIGKITTQGSEVIETIRGFKNALQFFKQLQTMETQQC